MEPGYYWYKSDGEWGICEVRNRGVELIGSDYPYTLPEFIDIYHPEFGEKIERPN
jgi:hypothetical protein